MSLPLPKHFTGDDPMVSPLNRMLDNIRGNQVLDGEHIKWERKPNGVRPVVRIPGVESGGEVEQFRVVGVCKDYIKARRCTIAGTITGDLGEEAGVLTVTEDSELVRIAKPFELRATPFDGQAFNGRSYEYFKNGPFNDLIQNPYNHRHVTVNAAQMVEVTHTVQSSEVGAQTFSEHIHPEYLGGVSIIYAIKVKQKPIFRVVETGVNTPGGPEIETTYDVDWVDLNIDGRRFEHDYLRIKVCILTSGGVTQTGFVSIRSSALSGVSSL